jgi:hypothetical protein
MIMTKLKTINIKGKEYVEVNERIRAFRELYPNGSIMTEMVSNENGMCVFKTNIIVDNQILATGHAYEREGSTFINKTSYVENCETSSIGRALGVLGIGIDTSVASAEEVGNAIAQQKQPEEISDDDLQALKDQLDKAHAKGHLKQFFHSMTPMAKEKLRDYANDLRTS